MEKPKITHSSKEEICGFVRVSVRADYKIKLVMVINDQGLVFATSFLNEMKCGTWQYGMGHCLEMLQMLDRNTTKTLKTFQKMCHVNRGILAIF